MDSMTNSYYQMSEENIHGEPHIAGGISMSPAGITSTMNMSAVARNKTKSKVGAKSVSGKDCPGRWTAEEHMLFLKGLQMYGKSWRKISEVVKTRTVVQIRTHAQKYLIKLEKAKSVGHNGILMMDGKGVGDRSSASSSSLSVSSSSKSTKTRRGRTSRTESSQHPLPSLDASVSSLGSSTSWASSPTSVSASGDFRSPSNQVAAFSSLALQERPAAAAAAAHVTDPVVSVSSATSDPPHKVVHKQQQQQQQANFSPWMGFPYLPNYPFYMQAMQQQQQQQQLMGMTNEAPKDVHSLPEYNPQQALASPDEEHMQQGDLQRSYGTMTTSNMFLDGFYPFPYLYYPNFLLPLAAPAAAAAAGGLESLSFLDPAREEDAAAAAASGGKPTLSDTLSENPLDELFRTLYGNQNNAHSQNKVLPTQTTEELPVPNPENLNTWELPQDLGGLAWLDALAATPRGSST